MKCSYCVVVAFMIVFSVSLQVQVQAQSTINFSGITWNLKSGNTGPGPNYFSSNKNNVWVDSIGRLHLKIRNVNGIWYCSELIAPQSFGYGEYRIYLASNPENYDKNIVLGLFTYENDTREIDIEFSRWGNASNVDGWYTVQPVSSMSQRSFPLNLSSNYSTHRFIWTPDSISFLSYQGRTLSPPSLISQWNYIGNQNPPSGNERFHLNFWLFGGSAPSNGLDAEVVIDSISIFTGSVREVLKSSDNNLNGAQWSIDDGIWQNSGTKVYLKSGNHLIKFKSVSGYISPSPKTVSVKNNTILNDTSSYVRINTGINASSKIDNLNIFPIPCKNKIFIQLNSSGCSYVLYIYNIIGEIMCHKYISINNDLNISFDVSSLPKGIYFLKLQSSGEYYIKRFIKE